VFVCQFEAFLEDADDMGPPSPRDIFLNCILESQHMPTAGELLRKSTSTSFNIAHKVGPRNHSSVSNCERVARGKFCVYKENYSP
jgi:hypothetical protein